MEPQMVRGSEEYESKRSLPAEKPEKKEKAKKKYPMCRKETTAKHLKRSRKERQNAEGF